VTVVDILPTCLSSVYSFFDPILSKTLQLGKITALREIEWVQRAQVHRPELKYYYLGFYVNSCPKMSYKAEYKPSSLLCPTYGTWVDFEQANQRLEKYSPVRNICTLMANDDDSSDKHPPKVYTLNGFDIAKDMKIDIGSGNLVSLNQLNELGRNLLLPIVKEFVAEVGEDIAGNCIIKL
jgi:arginine-tRNA-protein transferase